MKSEHKMDVKAKPFDKYGGKHWVLVSFNGSGAEWIPSFEDLFRIIQAICFCEDEKYPNGRGRFMVRDFMHDACEQLKPGERLADRWEELRDKYQLFERGA